MDQDRHVFNAEAYQDGVRAGHYDRLAGARSDYAWHGSEPVYTYAWHYGRGYRDGWDRRTAPRCAQCHGTHLDAVGCERSADPESVRAYILGGGQWPPK